VKDIKHRFLLWKLSSTLKCQVAREFLFCQTEKKSDPTTGCAKPPKLRNMEQSDCGFLDRRLDISPVTSPKWQMNLIGNAFFTFS
jgi:hypothetical protein